MLANCGAGEGFALLQAEIFAAEELGRPITQKSLNFGERKVLNFLCSSYGMGWDGMG